MTELGITVMIHEGTMPGSKPRSALEQPLSSVARESFKGSRDAAEGACDVAGIDGAPIDAAAGAGDAVAGICPKGEGTTAEAGIAGGVETLGASGSVRAKGGGAACANGEAGMDMAGGGATSAANSAGIEAAPGIENWGAATVGTEEAAGEMPADATTAVPNGLGCVFGARGSCAGGTGGICAAGIGEIADCANGLGASAAGDGVCI